MMILAIVHHQVSMGMRYEKNGIVWQMEAIYGMNERIPLYGTLSPTKI